MNQPNQVQEMAPKPPGLLPKNVQSWLLIGLALVMVLIMWLTGGKKPQAPTKAIPPAPIVQAPLEVNDAKIAELQNRIQELQRDQLVAENALAQQTNRPMNRVPSDMPQTQQSTAAGNVRLFPAGQPVPTVSSINYSAGETRANNAIVALDASGQLAAFVGQPAGSTADLIIDVNGYFE